MVESKQKRIIFIDLMRAFAVFMMVQGHTVDSFLSPEFKSPDSPIFGLWNYLRGFTAPIFMFSAGVAFTYLFRLNGEKFKSNPRVKKGLKRFLLLIVIAYFLRFPTYRIFDYSNVTPDQWASFFTVDTLHLIAFGLLFIMFAIYLSEKLKVDDIHMLIFGAVLFLALQIVFEPINWVSFMHPLFAGYFYAGSGSFFPLFPWVAYLLCGGALGSKIARNPEKVKNSKFGIKVMLIALAVFAFGKSLEQIKFAFNWGEPFWVNAIYLFTLRLSVVIFLNGLMSLIAHRVNNIPKVVKLFGRYSLLIYVVHVIALYGDTWFPGFNEQYYQKFSVLPTILFAALMLSLMGLMVIGIDRIKMKIKKRRSVTEKPKFKIEMLKNEKISQY